MKGWGALMALCFAALCLAPLPALADQEIKSFVRGSYQQIVAARQGKPFVVSFWSLTCSYCIAEMSLLKKLHKKYPGLDLVMISTDTLEEKNAVRAVLADYSLDRADAWVFADGYAERLRYEVDRTWQGELPRTYLFDAKSAAIAISGKLEGKEMERWVKAHYAP